MILYPPVRFDANEWFVIISSVVMWTIIFKLPRRFSYTTAVMIWVFNVFLAQTTDFTIGVDPFDLYDFGDRTEFEYFDLALYYLTYPPAAYFVLYFYDRWKLAGWKKWGYIIGCAAVTAAAEWATARWAHLFFYKGWNVWFSWPVYIAVYALNVELLKFIKKRLPVHPMKAG